MPHSNKSKSNTRTKTSRTPKKTNTAKKAKTTKQSLFYLATPPRKRKEPCYIPLCLSSQSGHSHVLYYNANAPAEELFDCATARLQAVIDLMENLFEYNTPPKTTVPAVATVSSYLLNDAMTLLQELNPTATALKAKLATTTHSIKSIIKNTPPL